MIDCQILRWILLSDDIFLCLEDFLYVLFCFLTFYGVIFGSIHLCIVPSIHRVIFASCYGAIVIWFYLSIVPLGRLLFLDRGKGNCAMHSGHQRSPHQGPFCLGPAMIVRREVPC